MSYILFAYIMIASLARLYKSFWFVLIYWNMTPVWLIDWLDAQSPTFSWLQKDTAPAWRVLTATFSFMSATKLSPVTDTIPQCCEPNCFGWGGIRRISTFCFRIYINNPSYLKKNWPFFRRLSCGRLCPCVTCPYPHDRCAVVPSSRHVSLISGLN